MSELREGEHPDEGDDSIDFASAEESMTSSWARSLEESAAIEPMTPGEFAVKYETSDTAHIVHLAGDGAAYAGRCTCSGYQFHDGPCAHLCAVFQRSLEEPTLVPEVDLR